MLGGIKKATTISTATTRRAALGNLVNRTDKPRNINDKKVTNQSNSSENVNHTGGIDLKNVKPRVDTHWKNEPLRKPASRTNSVRKASLTSVPSIASVQSGPKLVKTKTIETASLKEVKVIDKPMLIKRQDSTLTRRAKIVSGSGKTSSIPTIGKSQISRTKSTDTPSEEPKLIADIPPVQSRFRPPSFTGSYSNGLIDGVSTYNFHFFSQFAIKTCTFHRNDEHFSLIYNFSIYFQFGGLNIDDGDEENALLVCEYVNEIYAYMFDMEQKYAIRKNHLDGQQEVHPRMRTVLLDWISEVHTQYHFAQETFHIAVSTIDRYLQVSDDSYAIHFCLVFISRIMKKIRQFRLLNFRIYFFFSIFCFLSTGCQINVTKESPISRSGCIAHCGKIRGIVSTRGARLCLYHRQYIHERADSVNGKAYAESELNGIDD